MTHWDISNGINKLPFDVLRLLSKAALIVLPQATGTENYNIVLFLIVAWL